MIVSVTTQHIKKGRALCLAAMLLGGDNVDLRANPVAIAMRDAGFDDAMASERLFFARGLLGCTPPNVRAQLERFTRGEEIAPFRFSLAITPVDASTKKRTQF